MGCDNMVSVDEKLLLRMAATALLEEQIQDLISLFQSRKKKGEQKEASVFQKFSLSKHGPEMGRL